MPDNATITPGTGKTVLADEVTDATLGTGVVQMVKIMDGTLDGTSKAAVSASGLAVDTELPAAATLTDTDTNPTAPTIGAALMAWTGAAWKRVATAAALDARNPPSGPGVMAFPFVYNGASWDMVRGDAANGLDIDVTRLPALTKGMQVATGVTTQDLKDAGRNQTNYHMTLPIVTTATDALQSLTGYKANAAVAATITPAVVTSGKTYRITAIALTYVAVATAGSAKFTLRFNSGGAVAIASPAVAAWVVGGPAVAAGVATTVNIDIPDGLEFPAAGGIGLSMVGLGTTQAAAAVGYGQAAIHGFEY